MTAVANWRTTRRPRDRSAGPRPCCRPRRRPAGAALRSASRRRADDLGLPEQEPRQVVQMRRLLDHLAATLVDTAPPRGPRRRIRASARRRAEAAPRPGARAARPGCRGRAGDSRRRPRARPARSRPPGGPGRRASAESGFSVRNGIAARHETLADGDGPVRGHRDVDDVRLRTHRASHRRPAKARAAPSPGDRVGRLARSATRPRRARSAPAARAPRDARG